MTRIKIPTGRAGDQNEYFNIVRLQRRMTTIDRVALWMLGWKILSE